MTLATSPDTTKSAETESVPTFEVFFPLNEGARRLYTDFIQTEKNLFDQLYPQIDFDQPDAQTLMTNRSTLREYQDHFKHIHLLLQSQQSGAFDPMNQDRTVMIVAKKGDTMVGFALSSFTQDKTTVDNTFLGVSWAERQRGIGSQLVEHCHQLFQKLGIHQYQTDLWPGSLAVFEKLQREGKIESVTNVGDPSMKSKKYQIVLNNHFQ